MHIIIISYTFMYHITVIYSRLCVNQGVEGHFCMGCNQILATVNGEYIHGLVMCTLCECEVGSVCMSEI